MTKYVLGFAFTQDYSLNERVLLIRKTKPEWQKGKLNGIGGKIEKDDFTAHRAMSREFREETGLDTLPAAWTRFAIMQFPEAEIHCFVTRFDWKTFKHSRDMTEEKLEHFHVDSDFLKKMQEAEALPNLLWLIPMAQSQWWGTGPVLLIREEGDLMLRISGEGLTCE